MYSHSSGNFPSLVPGLWGKQNPIMELQYQECQQLILISIITSPITIMYYCYHHRYL
jgi:hypothetical protein